MNTATIKISENIGEITEEGILVAVLDWNQHMIDESKVFATDEAAMEYAVEKMAELDPEMDRETAVEHYADGYYDCHMVRKSVYVTTTVLHRR